LLDFLSKKWLNPPLPSIKVEILPERAKMIKRFFLSFYDKVRTIFVEEPFSTILISGVLLCGLFVVLAIFGFAEAGYVLVVLALLIAYLVS
jgi:hypothetical protein